MNRIDSTFEMLRSQERKALVCYLTAGFPDAGSTVELAAEACRRGADIIELGVPFSDPIADGPIIQRTSHAALEGGVTPRSVFETAGRLRERAEAPVVLLTYYNPVLQYGPDRFVRDCVSSGVDGLVVPDLPLEESAELRETAHSRGVWLIGLVAPTSTPDRIARICSVSRGFIYCVSVTGVTGLRAGLWEGLGGFAAAVRRASRIPVAIGFGISGPEQAREAASYADGVIVGSAIMQRLGECAPGDRVAAVGGFVEELRLALDAGGAGD